MILARLHYPDHDFVFCGAAAHCMRRVERSLGQVWKEWPGNLCLPWPHLPRPALIQDIRPTMVFLAEAISAELAVAILQTGNASLAAGLDRPRPGCEMPGANTQLTLCAFQRREEAFRDVDQATVESELLALQRINWTEFEGMGLAELVDIHPSLINLMDVLVNVVTVQPKFAPVAWVTCNGIHIEDFLFANVAALEDGPNVPKSSVWRKIAFVGRVDQ